MSILTGKSSKKNLNFFLSIMDVAGDFFLERDQSFCVF